MGKNLRNTILILSGKVISMCFFMALDSVIAKFLGINGYAEWNFFFSIATIIFDVSWFGVNNASKIFLAGSSAEECNNYFTAAVCLRIGVSIVFSLGVLFILTPMLIKTGICAKYANISALLYISGYLVFFSAWTDFTKQIFQGVNEFIAFFLVTILEYGGYFLFSLLFLCFMHNVYAVTLGYAAAGLLVFIISLWLFKKKKYYFRICSIEKKKVREIFFYAIPLAISGMGGLVLMEIDTFMMGVYSNSTQISLYALAKNLCQKATQVNLAFITATITSFTVLNIQNIKEKRRLFHLYYLINLIIMAVVICVMALGCPLYIDLLYGSSFEATMEIIWLLLIYYGLCCVSSFYTFLLEFQKQAWLKSIAYIVVIVVDFLLNRLWIPVHGAKGAAWSTIISMIPYTIIVITGGNMLFKKIERRKDST